MHASLHHKDLYTYDRNATHACDKVISYATITIQLILGIIMIHAHDITMITHHALLMVLLGPRMIGVIHVRMTRVARGRNTITAQSMYV